MKVTDSKFRSTILRNEEVVVPAVESWDGITQDYTREAVDFIRRHRDRPFFLYLAHNMPHIPLGASEWFKGKSAGGPFGDAVEEIDWSCGEIVKTLRELGLAGKHARRVHLRQRALDRDNEGHGAGWGALHSSGSFRECRSPARLQDADLGGRPARALCRVVAGKDPRRLDE